jgi:hypothetical protein
VCSMLILLVSISLSTCVVFLLSRAPLLSFLVLVHMLKMLSPSVSIVIFLRPPVL